MGVAQAAPQIRFSTHDWTAPLPASEVNSLLHEVWADVKTPGDGLVYSVGTVEVNRVDAVGTLFSNFAAAPAGPLGPFARGPGQIRQVVMLQATNAASQSIVWQRFYYGLSGPTVIDRPTNARGISVWPAADPADTRVVICGETFDAQLLSQPAWALANGTNASGFLAVFDGQGNLLWDHQFFGAIQAADCAITDVSVRVEFANGEPVDDVITYCGISSHGSPINNLTLSPTNWFLAPGALCPTSAIGDTDNGPGQWDGFVGRIVRNHNGAPPTATRFHAVVGGNQQDGLFGISELPEDRFVVAGSTAGGRAGVPLPNPGSLSTFPLTSGTCLPQASVAPGHCLATLLYFDAAPTATGGNLILERALEFGNQGETSTMARDVHAQGAPNVAINDAAYIVGSTTDANLFAVSTTLLITTPLAAYGGGSDGFLLCAGPLAVGGTMVIPFATFRGGAGDEGLTGVQAWNEFGDQAVVTGFAPGAGVDFDVASFYGYTAGYIAPPIGLSLRPLTDLPVGGSGFDRPAAMGPLEVTVGINARLPFAEFGLGNPAGGGVSQDKDGRVCATGHMGNTLVRAHG